MAIQQSTYMGHKKNKLRINQQVMLLEKLAELLDQGYPIIDALSIIKVNQRWQAVSDYLAEQLQAGRRFDSILEELHFDQQIVTFIYFALQHGNLTEAIRQSVQFINQQIKLMSQFKQVIRYPLFLLSFFLVMLFCINLYVYPAFMDLYSSHSQPSNLLLIATQIVDMIFFILYYLGIFSLCIVIISLFMIRKLNIKQKVTLIHLLRFPRPIIRKYCSLMFATHFSSLLDANLSFKSCLTLIVEHKKETFINFYCRAILSDLNSGLSFEQSLNKHAFFDRQLNDLFSSKTNQLLIKRDLSTYAMLLSEQIKARTLKVIKCVQPTIFIIIAISVIFIYLSILLPMLQLIQTI